MEAPTSRWFGHLAGIKFCPWYLAVLCLVLLRVWIKIRTLGLRKNVIVPLNHPSEHNRFQGHHRHLSQVILEPSGQSYVSVGITARSVGAKTQHAPSVSLPQPLHTQLDMEAKPV